MKNQTIINDYLKFKEECVDKGIFDKEEIFTLYQIKLEQEGFD